MSLKDIFDLMDKVSKMNVGQLALVLAGIGIGWLWQRLIPRRRVKKLFRELDLRLWRDRSGIDLLGNTLRDDRVAASLERFAEAFKVQLFFTDGRKNDATP